MMKLKDRRQQVIRLQFVLPLCLLCASCLSPHPRLRTVEERELPKAIALAEQLGYKEEAQLVRVRHCAPSLVSTALSCHLSLAYEVDMVVADFAALIADLSLKPVIASTGDGRDLLQHLNHFYYRLPNEEAHTPLTIDGNAGSLGREQLQILPEFLKYYWQFSYSEEQWLLIEFYETAPLDPHLMLGERVVQGNVAVIKLDIGTVLP